MMTIIRTGLLATAVMIAVFVMKPGVSNALDWEDAFNPNNLIDQEMVWDHMKTFSFTRVKEMEGFKEKLYALVGGNNEAKLYRLNNLGCESWSDETPQWNPGTGAGKGAMAVYKDSLYLGTDNGEIFKTTDGTNWQHAEGNISEIKYIDDMNVFKDRLYISGSIDDGTSSAPIWSTDGDGTWEPALEQPDTSFTAMEVFDGRIYGGKGFDNDNGIVIWRSSDGEHWELFRFHGPEEDSQFPIQYPGHVHAMKAYKSHLYIGVYHNNEFNDLIRTNGTPDSWESITVLSRENNFNYGNGVLAMEEHKGRLYVGFDLEQAPLFESENGESWNKVDGEGVDVSDFNKIVIMKSFRDRLFIGSESSSSTPTAHIYNYGIAPAPECVFPGTFWDVFDELPIVPIQFDRTNKSIGDPYREDWMLPSIRRAMDAAQTLAGC